jgi:hypothetical protein
VGKITKLPLANKIKEKEKNLVPASHKLDTGPQFKVPLNRYLTICKLEYRQMDG